MPEQHNDWADRASIFDIVLGQYTFGGSNVEIFHGRTTGSHDADVTTIHEASHLQLCLSTPFGVFQDFISRLSDHPAVASKIKIQCQIALNASIDQSWFTYEGVATASEILLLSLKKGSNRLLQLSSHFPKSYKKAVTPFVNLFSNYSFPILVYSSLIEAIGYSAMATDILEEMTDFGTFKEANWSDYYGSADRSPDRRLEMILSYLSKANNRSKLEYIISEFLEFRFGKLSKEEYMKAFAESPAEDLSASMLEIGRLIINEIISSTPLKIISLKSLKQQFTTFNNSWANCLDGLKVVSRDSAVTKETDFIKEWAWFMKSVEYVPKQFDFASGYGQLSFKARDRVWNYIQNSTKILLIFILYNEFDKIIGGNNPLAIPPHGACLFMHATDFKAKEYNFHCPSPGVPDKWFNAPLTIVVNRSELSKMINEVRNIPHVKCMPEGPHTSFLKHFSEQALCEEYSPLVLIASSSTPSHWSHIINYEIQPKGGWLYIGPVNPGNRNTWDFLVGGMGDGSIVFAKPTSKFILHHFDSESIEILTSLSNSFSEAWRQRLGIACQHYFDFGW